MVFHKLRNLLQTQRFNDYCNFFKTPNCCKHEHVYDHNFEIQFTIRKTKFKKTSLKIAGT